MPRDYKTVFPDQKHLNVVFILLINAKIPTVVGILAFLSGEKNRVFFSSCTSAYMYING